MSKFNLHEYETVKMRKQRFYTKYPDGRIIVDAVVADDNSALFKAMVFKSADDQARNLPFATGFAQEFKGKGSFANNTSWTENCEESSVGRALDNAGFSGNNKCSREEIEKVERAGRALGQQKAQELKSQMVAPIPACSKCGKPMMVSKYHKKAWYCASCKHKTSMAGPLLIDQV